MPASPSKVRFGLFELDLRAAELRKQGRKVRLQEQPFQILAMLLDRPGDLVTREEVRQRLWPAETFVDFDHGLNNAVARLREALGDAAEAPRYVETVARRGYRFVGEAEREGVAAAPAVAQVMPATGSSNARVARRPMTRALLTALAVASLLMGVGAIRLVRQGAAAPAGGPAIRSLAVLPFDNLSGDPAQEYFVDGLTDALTTDLAQVAGLRVISRTSAMQYKGKRKPLPEIARELGVDAVVEGSVARSGGRVRITAQLVDAPRDRHLWARSYERQDQDVLALQGEAARAIAAQVRKEAAPHEPAPRASPLDPEAYEAYLKGRYFWNKRTAEGFKKAVDYFQRAIALEPAYAQAYSGLSDCYRMMQLFDPIPPGQSWSTAKAAADKALALDDSLAEAHTSLAVYLYRHDWDWARSEKEFQRAIALNPSHAEAHRAYSVMLRIVGRFPESAAEKQKALDLDPLSVVLRAEMATDLYFARQYDRAVVELRKALEMDPGQVFVRDILGRALAQKRDFPAAVSVLEDAVRLSGENPSYLADLGYVYALAGEGRRARSLLDGLERGPRSNYVPTYALATLHAALGEKDRAFATLDAARADRAFQIVILGIDPQMDGLRSDPRFRELLRRMGLPGA